MQTQANDLYRKLPQLGDVLEGGPALVLLRLYSRDLVARSTRTVLARLRAEISAGAQTAETLESQLSTLPEAIERELRTRLRPRLRRVINATGVILQTNLGRAPLSEAAIAHIAEVAAGYCNIELDLTTGERGRRDALVESLTLEVLSLRSSLEPHALQRTHGAAVVNNCAAATLLALNTLAEGGEVIVSRGELVEIGGGFRVPDILRKSGAILREVGTTNRTRLADYAEAITADTRLILRVHRSNFRIEGFTEQPSLQELATLGAETAIPVFEDQGTGSIVSLDPFGIRNESSWVESAASGIALVASSGDKLLGGPQCGLLVGTRNTIERIRKNPLFRALRVDKLTYAALEATLLAYLSGEEESLPTVSMLRTPAEAIEARCHAWASALASHALSATVVPVRSLVGGGTTPGASLPSFAVALRHAELSEDALLTRLRELDPPIIGRIQNGSVLLDLRTVPAKEDAGLQVLIDNAFSERGTA